MAEAPLAPLEPRGQRGRLTGWKPKQRSFVASSSLVQELLEDQRLIVTRTVSAHRVQAILWSTAIEDHIAFHPCLKDRICLPLTLG